MYLVHNMPRKTTASTKSAASASTASTTTVASTAAAPAKRGRKPKTPAAAAPVAAETVAAPVVAETVVAADAAVENPLGALTETFTEFAGKLTQMTSQFSALRAEFRALEKRAIRELRAATKASAKKKKRAGNRQPSGFVKPTKISNELATFLGREPGTEMARTDVTREINKYIRANQLQDKDNGRKINPDASLRSLLNIPTGEELTYFNLQRYMSPHFAKAGAAAPVAK